MKPYSKKNQVKHGKYDNILSTHIFPRESYLLGSPLGDKRIPPPHPEIYLQNFSTQYLVVKFHKRLQIGHIVNIQEHLFEKKIFLICFSLLSLQAEQKEDDENFVNHLHISVSRTFTKAKTSALCAEYQMGSKFHLSKWKIDFSQFIDKFLKTEELEDIIHYIKFKM